MNLRYCSSCASCMGLGLLSLVFFYPIDFVVKHPVAPEVNPVPTLGWVRTAALRRCSKVNISSRHSPSNRFLFRSSTFLVSNRGIAKIVPQRLKPSSAEAVTARVNPCPSLEERFVAETFTCGQASAADPFAALRSESPRRFGGADRDRTGDPLLAKQVLSQLSYSPLPS